MDLGVYPITMAHLILGKPDSIIAHGKLTAMGVDSDVSMIFNYRDSKSALLHTTIEAVTPTRATIVGSEGRIEIDRSFYAPTDFTLHRHDGSSFQYENPLIVNGYVGLGEQAKEVLRCIDNEEIESPMRTAQETLEVMGILDQVRETIGLRYPSEIGDTDDSSVVP